MKKIHQIKELILSNKKVIENYFFMTILQFLNSFFYLLIYPYLIRTLGDTGYGTFIFAFSVVNYFMFFISFGLDLPGTKSISQNLDNRKVLEETLSSIFTLKTCFYLLSFAILFVLIHIVPILKAVDRWIYVVCFVSIYSNVLFPQWYFQGIQKMRIVTYIQMGVRFLSLPIIFLCVRDKGDLFLYVVIFSLTNILGSIIAYIIIRYKHRLRITLIGWNRAKKWLSEGKPFFYSSLSGAIKEYSIPVIVAHFFGMREVAIYDLANKIISVFRAVFVSVNSAIFPKLITNIKDEVVKKIIKIETLVSIVVMAIIVLFGRFFVDILGGKEMSYAYYLSIVLSFTVMSWLVVGAYVNFVFVPHHKGRFVAVNQVVAMLSFFFFAFVGLVIKKDILVIALAISLSGLMEILYCVYVSQRNKLLKW